MVMGPTCGMVLADLGADVIKVEPLVGDSTRKLLGSGAGFYPLFNRNKKSLAINLQSAKGREVVLKLIATADIVSENFKTETMQKLGLDYATLSARDPQRCGSGREQSGDGRVRVPTERRRRRGSANGRRRRGRFRRTPCGKACGRAGQRVPGRLRS
jgi:hypothetical protein